MWKWSMGRERRSRMKSHAAHHREDLEKGFLEEFRGIRNGVLTWESVTVSQGDFFFLSYNAGVFSYIKLRMLWFLQITYTHPSHGPAQLPPSPWLSLEVIKLHMQPRDDLQVVFAHSLGQKSWGGEAWRGWEGMQGCPGECGSRFNQCGISSSCGPEEHLCFSWSVIRDGWWAP